MPFPSTQRRTKPPARSPPRTLEAAEHIRAERELGYFQSVLSLKILYRMKTSLGWR